MAATAISGLTALTAPAGADQLIVVDDSAGDNKSLALSYLALVGAANVFTAAQTIPAIVTASGALTVTPAAGSGVAIVLSGAGDLAVNTNQLYVDTSTGNVGIGTTGPDARLNIVSTTGNKFINLETSTNVLGEFSGISFGTNPGDRTKAAIGMVNTNTGNTEGALALYTSTSTTLTERLRIDYDGNVGIGDTAPSGKLHIDQSSTTAATPVLKLDQADNSEGFVDFIGTSAASAAGPISTWTVATIAGYVRCEINGAAYWMPYYNAPTA